MIAKLEMFIALAKERHFGRAAESLGLTQPTLSTGIKQLEEQLGVKLVFRGARYGGLTPECQRALVWARQIVGDARRFREEMRHSREGLSGHIRIAVIPTALTWAARLTSRFNEENPRVRFTILSRTSVEILEMIENLDVDAGVSYLDNEPLGRVSTAPLYKETYSLICGPLDPLGERDKVEWRELAGVKLCLLTPDMQNRRIINKNFMDANIAPQAKVESNSTVALMAHVEEGGWATILPTHMAHFLVAGKNLRIIPLEPSDGGHAVGLVAPYREPHTPVLQALLEEARKMSQLPASGSR